MKRLLACGFAAALVSTSTFAITNEKLTELRTKAEAGNGISQYNLGLVYADPQEPTANILEAYVWFSLAADNGAPGKALMIVTNQMSPEQLSDGKKLLEQRRADLAAHRPIVVAPLSAASNPVKAVNNASPVVAASTEADTTAIQAELKKTSDELATAKQENQKLKTQIDKSHQEALEQLRQERDKLAATVANYTNEISTMRAAAANFEGERNVLQQKAADASRQTKDGVASELAATTAKLKAAESELAKADANLTELTTTKQALAALNEQLQKLTGENQRLNSLVKQTESTSGEKLAASEKTLNEISSELLRTQAKLADASVKAAVAATASADLSTQRQTNSDLSNQIQKLTTERDQALAQAAAATTETQQQIKELSTKLKASEEAAAKALADHAELAKQLADIKTAPPKQDPEIQAQLAKFSNEIEVTQKSAAAEKETLTAKLKTAEENLAAANTARAELEQKLNASKPTQAAALAKVEQLKTELETAKAEAAKARANTEKSENTRKEINSLQAKLKKSEAALATATTENVDLEQKFKAVKPSKKEAAAQAKVDQLKAELDALRSESGTNQAIAAELEKSRQEISDLQTKLKNSDEALVAAKTAAASAASTAPSTETPATTVAATPAPDEAASELHKDLRETQIKLDSSLRSYQLQQNEVERLQNALANIDNERAKLAERLQSASTEAATAASRAAANNDAVAQLAGVREQLRQTQNQLASVAYENTEMKHRLSFATPAPTTLTPLPVTAPTAAPSRLSPSAEKPAGPRTHTVASGETLSTIAKRYYGNGNRWTEILEANKSTLRDPSALRVGMKLKVP